MNRLSHEPLIRKGPARLAVWMTSGVALFVLLGSLALVWAFERRIKREERHAFEELARVNAGFLERSRLPQSGMMAAQLGEIIGAKVFFWQTRTGEVVQAMPSGGRVFVRMIDAGPRVAVGSIGPTHTGCSGVGFIHAGSKNRFIRTFIGFFQARSTVIGVRGLETWTGG